MKLKKIKNKKDDKRKVNESFNRPFLQFKDQLDELKKRIKR